MKKLTARLVRAVLGIALVVGCADKEDPPPIDIDDTKEQSGDPEVTSTAALEVDEWGIEVRYDDSGAVVTVPVIVKEAGGSATVRAWITTLQEDERVRVGSQEFALTAGDKAFPLRLDGEAPPETQGAQAGYLVRYEIETGGGIEVHGQRSLYYASPKYGLRVWAPTRVDAGAQTLARVWLTNLTTGALIPDRKVTVNGASVTTDAGGQAEVTMEVPADATELEWVATATIDGNTVTAKRSVQVVLPGAPVVYVSTDKPLYRPGQTIHIRALTLSQKDLTPVGGEPVTLEVLDGKANKIFKQEVLTDEFGIASLTAALASQVNLGTYVIRAVMGGVTTEQYVEVSEEKLPKFAVDIAFDEPYFTEGSIVTGVLQARYFFGKPVIGAEVRLTLNNGGGRAVVLIDNTNDEGLMPFEIPADDAGYGTIPVAIEVTDSAGFSVEKEASFRILNHSLQVSLTPETQQVPKGLNARIYVTTRDAIGRAVAASCTANNNRAGSAQNF